MRRFPPPDACFLVTDSAGQKVPEPPFGASVGFNEHRGLLVRREPV
jgi:hypothetical protein